MEDALGMGPYGRAGGPSPTSSLPAPPPGKPDATLPEKIPTPYPGAASGSRMGGAGPIPRAYAASTIG